MTIESINYEAGETPMTDYQFKRYEELRDKCDELTRELALLREENADLKREVERLKNT